MWLDVEHAVIGQPVLYISMTKDVTIQRSDLEQVKLLGEFFEIDYHKLLKKEEGHMKDTMLTVDIETETQRNYTKERIREIYRAMLKFIDSCRYFYYELGSLIDEPSLSDESMESVRDANAQLNKMFGDIVDRLEYAMLDIPEETYDQIHEYVWMDLRDYIGMVANIDYEKDFEYYRKHPEDRDYVEESDRYMQDYLKGGYRKELRALFKDYIVKS